MCQVKGGTCPHENVKVTFAAITTFWFAQKEPKSLSLDMCHVLKIDLNVFAYRSPFQEHTVVVQIP